ncbi:hypothetical protein [Pinirhizobacter sp.]|jgi:hypothetical protein|uniref:hypothetical protein n=1 Tax=Pinirhizobacter sp. TaxID=2950432 RepID=UPI002F3F5E63
MNAVISHRPAAVAAGRSAFWTRAAVLGMGLLAIYLGVPSPLIYAWAIRGSRLFFSAFT